MEKIIQWLLDYWPIWMLILNVLGYFFWSKKKQISTSKKTKKKKKGQKKEKKKSDISNVISPTTYLLPISIIIFLIGILIGGWFWILSFLAIGMHLSWKKIEADPPHIGILTIWGSPKKIIIEAGWHMFANYFPLLISFINVKTGKINEDLVFEHIRCRFDEEENEKNNKKGPQKNNKSPKSGGSVVAYVDFTYRVDKEQAYKFVDTGKEEGVRKIVDGILGEDIRQMGREHTWEEMTFGTDALSARIILKIVGENIKENLEKEDVDEILGFENIFNKKEVDKFLADEEKVARFLRKALGNGVTDVHDLGIKILRLNVKKIDEEGDLKKYAEESAKELQQRRAENYELETEIKQAKVLLKGYQNSGDETKTFEDCILEIRRRKAIREGKGQVIDLAGSGIEGLITGLLGGKKK